MRSQDDDKEKALGNSIPQTVFVNQKLKPTPLSKWREALPQFFAVGAKNILLLTFGTSLGFPTILIPELQKSDSDVPVTLEQISWIGSINLFLVPLGGFVSGTISQRFGRRATMMFTTIPFVIAWLIFYNATSISMLIVGQAITGLTGGLLEAPVLTYVAEVTQPHLRGMLSATSTMAVICGVFSQMVTGSLVNWRMVALINIIYPLVCFISLYMVPESPMWLIGMGRLEDAEKSLCWLRGWSSPDNVQDEFHQLCESVQASKSVVAKKAKSVSSKADSQYATTEVPEKPWHIYLERKFLRPFSLVTWVFFINAFGGIMVLQVFAVLILDELGTPIDKYHATVIVGMAQVIGTVICVLIIHFTGKRKLSFFSVFFTGLSLFSIFVYSNLVLQKHIDPTRYSWIPTSLMVATAFFSHLGLKMLPWILAGEVFSLDTRSIATGAAGSIGYIFSSIANKLFIYMKTGLTLPGTFLFYAVVNFIGLLGLYYMLPETEGRTLQEIEDHFAQERSSKSSELKKQKKAAAKEKWAASNPQPVTDDFESRL